MIDRRSFVVSIASCLVAASFVVEAQQSGKVWRVGVLEVVPAALDAANRKAFSDGLRELGYVEGRNLIIEYRSAEGRGDRVEGLAQELVRLNVDVIVVRSTPGTLAAKKATQSIPIVMAGAGDPVGSGIVQSLARPGANVTGLSSLTVDTEAKRLGLLRELLPGIARVVVMSNLSTPNSPPQLREIETAARSMGIQTRNFDLRKPEDLPPAFESASRLRTDALVVGQDGLLQAQRMVIAELAARYMLPAIYRSREFVDAGGLMAYGPSSIEIHRRAAGFVDKILKGAKPGDLPIEQPSKFELVINLKTAKALGITIPQSLVLRADEVIR